MLMVWRHDHFRPPLIADEPLKVIESSEQLWVNQRSYAINGRLSGDRARKQEESKFSLFACHHRLTFISSNSISPPKKI